MKAAPEPFCLKLDWIELRGGRLLRPKLAARSKCRSDHVSGQMGAASPLTSLMRGRRPDLPRPKQQIRGRTKLEVEPGPWVLEPFRSIFAFLRCAFRLLCSGREFRAGKYRAEGIKSSLQRSLWYGTSASGHLIVLLCLVCTQPAIPFCASYCSQCAQRHSDAIARQPRPHLGGDNYRPSLL